MLDLILAVSPVAGLVINSLALIMLCRVRPLFGLLRAEYIGFAIGGMVVLFMNLFTLLIDPDRALSEVIGHGILTSMTYAALGYCHFHFVNLGETARRIRLLRELLDAGGTLSHHDLLERYNAREIVERRITRLINAGQIVYSGGRYYIGNSTVVLIARIMVGLKVLLLGKKSEYD